MAEAAAFAIAIFCGHRLAKLFSENGLWGLLLESALSKVIFLVSFQAFEHDLSPLRGIASSTRVPNDSRSFWVLVAGALAAPAAVAVLRRQRTAIVLSVVIGVAAVFAGKSAAQLAMVQS